MASIVPDPEKMGALCHHSAAHADCVVSDMDVVKAIQMSPTGTRGPYGTESLAPPIGIVKAYRTPGS